jgi:hypothetical protein
VLLHCEVWQKFVDVSEALATSVILIALIMEAVSISETSINFYQSTQRHPTPYSSPWEPETLQSIKKLSDSENKQFSC